MAESSFQIISFPGAKLPENYKAKYFSNFLRSLRQGNSLFKLVDSRAYFTNYHIYIEGLLNRPDSTVSLAVLSDDHDIVLGWALMAPNTLHYIFVNPELRQKQTGIAKSLLTQPFTTFTHLTHTGKSIWQSKFPNAIFNPF